MKQAGFGYGSGFGVLAGREGNNQGNIDRHLPCIKRRANYADLF